MEIKIGINQTDILFLTPTSNIPDMETPCLFSGQLLRDPRSVVAVSGCLGDEETSLSIASTLLPGGIVDISLVGGVAFQVTADEAIDVEDYVVPPQGIRKREVEESSPRPRPKFTSRSRDRSRSDDYEEYDYEVDDFAIPPPTRDRAGAREFFGSLPQRVLLETDIKYDNSLLGHFDGSDTKTKEWISRVVELSKPRMSHKSLAMPIFLKTGKIDHMDRSLKAGEQGLFFLTSTDSPRSMTSYFCEDISGETNIRGYAWGGSACRTDGYAVNINELFTTSNSELRTAKNFAHELGHNLGMMHDFADDHGGKTGPCNKEGLMSYGGKRPDKWSECSNKDFTGWWMREGHACVKGTSGNDNTECSSCYGVVFQKDPEFSISHGQKIGELSSIGKEFIITFELFLTNVATSEWSSVIHFTIGGDDDAYGDRTPALFLFYGKTVSIMSVINGNSNYQYDIDSEALTLTTKKWYTFELSQLLIGNEYLFNVKIDDKTYWNKANKKAEQFDNVAIFAGDPWWNPAAGKMRNVTVKLKNK